jgi:hypothetical protein
MSIIVPPAARARLARENLVKAVLGAVEQAGEEGYPVARLRERFRILGVPVSLAEHVEARLVRENIVTLKADRLYLGSLEDIRGFLARSKWDEGRIAAVAPEEPSPLIVAPGGAA